MQKYFFLMQRGFIYQALQQLSTHCAQLLTLSCTDRCPSHQKKEKKKKIAIIRPWNPH